MLQAHLDDLKGTFDNCDLCDLKVVPVVVYLFKDSGKEVQKVYTACRVRTDDFLLKRTSAVVINSLIQCFLTKTCSRMHIMQLFEPLKRLDGDK